MKKLPETIFREHGGQLRMGEALAEGISRYTLYSLRDKGIIEKISRGVYRIKKMGEISNPDLVTVSLRFPKAVVCLISALSFHEITTQIPHEISIAVSQESRIPILDYPPVKAHKFACEAFNSGIETHQIDGTTVKVYGPEKTIVDCFKFRNKIGMDIVIEALKLYRSRKKFNLPELLRFAAICRVEKVMRPYLEAIV